MKNPREEHLWLHAPNGEWNERLVSSDASDHFVQFYRDEDYLARVVAEYLGVGLRKGESAVVIATPGHRALFEAALAREFDVKSLTMGGRVVFLDARETLRLFMRNGRPDWELFRALVVAAFDRAEAMSINRRVRAYGEMVDILCWEGKPGAALELERYWNDLGRARSFPLFCAYRASGLEQNGSMPWEHACTVHSHVLPDERPEDFETAVSGALDETLGKDQADAVRAMVRTSRPANTRMPFAESVLLWVRLRLHAVSDEVLARARKRYTAGEPRSG